MEQETLPEHESVESFAEFLVAEERISFTFGEADTVAVSMKIATYMVIEGLKDYGFIYQGRAEMKKVRGFTTNSHDRWYGPGSSKTHGGSGHEQITGFAGQKG